MQAESSEHDTFTEAQKPPRQHSSLLCIFLPGFISGQEKQIVRFFLPSSFLKNLPTLPQKLGGLSIGQLGTVLTKASCIAFNCTL